MASEPTHAVYLPAFYSDVVPLYIQNSVQLLSCTKEGLYALHLTSGRSERYVVQYQVLMWESDASGNIFMQRIMSVSTQRPTDCEFALCDSLSFNDVWLCPKKFPLKDLQCFLYLLRISAMILVSNGLLYLYDTQSERSLTFIPLEDVYDGSITSIASCPGHDYSVLLVTDRCDLFCLDLRFPNKKAKQIHISSAQIVGYRRSSIQVFTAHVLIVSGTLLYCYDASPLRNNDTDVPDGVDMIFSIPMMLSETILHISSRGNEHILLTHNKYSGAINFYTISAHEEDSRAKPCCTKLRIAALASAEDMCFSFAAYAADTNTLLLVSQKGLALLFDMAKMLATAKCSTN